MKRGAWHQFGDKSQKLIKEQLELGNGVGVILSPSNLHFKHVKDRSQQYRDLGAQTILDTQFFDPEFENKHLRTFELTPFRQSVTALCQISDQDLGRLSNRLEQLNRELGTSALLAPAVAYEAGRAEIIDLNTKLFNAAKAAGDMVGIPTYSTILLSSSAIATEALGNEALSHATSLSASGCYYAVELDDQERIPTDPSLVNRIAGLGLTLSCTGLPVLHAYAGLTGLISVAVGADAAAFGHNHNLRYFSTSRFEPRPDQPRKAPPPPRYLSGPLWGTIVYPDETTLMSSMWEEIRTASPFSPNRPNEPLGTWEANRHYLYVLSRELTNLCASSSAIACANSAIQKLSTAIELHARIARTGLVVNDKANAHQAVWRDAIQALITSRRPDYDYLTMLGK